MTLAERTLVCQDCGENFAFTVGEQEFYQEKGFQNDPKRCPECRKMRKSDRNVKKRKNLVTVICSECGKETQVPFEPKEGRPVYCRDCFEKQQ